MSVIRVKEITVSTYITERNVDSKDERSYGMCPIQHQLQSHLFCRMSGEYTAGTGTLVLMLSKEE